MHKIFYLWIATVFAWSAGPEKLKIERMKMEIEIIPEDYNGGYSLSWYDTLCTEFTSAPSYLQSRPYELHCYITDVNSDTLGYYHGLSSPRQFTYFTTKNKSDSIINIKFLVGVNYFSTFLANQSEGYIEQFNDNNKELIEFHPVRINLNQATWKKTEVELVNISNKP